MPAKKVLEQISAAIDEDSGLEPQGSVDTQFNVISAAVNFLVGAEISLVSEGVLLEFETRQSSWTPKVLLKPDGTWTWVEREQ